MDDYKANEPLAATFRPELGQFNVSWKAITLKPGAIIGDAIHNLRAALDLMASELARRNGASDKDVYFPFAASADDLDAAIKARCFHKAGPASVKLLKESIHPYRGGNDTLCAVHDLDIQDKHTGIPLTGSKMDIEISVVYHLDGTSAPQTQANLAAMRYLFSEDSPIFPGRDSIETLKELTELITGVLEAFATLIAPRP